MLNRLTAIRWVSWSSLVLAGLLLCDGFLHDANGQTAQTKTDELGVRHSVFAAVELDRNADFVKGDADKPIATMHVAVRILDYASDSRFYGVVNGDFSEFDPIQGVSSREIWADRKCHQNRGFPKIWIVALNGWISQGTTRIDIAARPRHIGQLLPSDEIVLRKVVTMGVGDSAPHLDMRVTTKRSPLSVVLTVKSTVCRLKAD
jgi:hypothetical protein